MTRRYRLYIILSVTHRLPADGFEQQDLLEYLSGLTLPAPTHFLGVRDVCAEWLLEQHPQLRDVPPIPRFRDDDVAGMETWATEQAVRLGASMLPLEPLPAERAAAIPDYLERVLDHVPEHRLPKMFVVDPADIGGSV